MIEEQFQIKLGVYSLEQTGCIAGVKWARMAVFKFAAAQSQFSVLTEAASPLGWFCRGANLLAIGALVWVKLAVSRQPKP